MRSSHRSIVLAAVVALLALMLPAAALATVSTGDGVWKWQNPLPQGNSITGGFFLDAQNGWVVGDHGTIIHTADGGVTWEGQRSGTIHKLKSVFFTDAQHGWAVGGMTLHETDGINLGLWIPDCIVATTDGGATWRGQNPGFTGINPRINVDLESVYFVDDQHGWAVGSWYYESLILATSDGGKTWQRQGPHRDKLPLHSVTFTDATHGTAVGGNPWDQDGYYILTTSDAGEHWGLHNVLADSDPNRSSYDLYSVSFADAQNGWAVGMFGFTSRTTDGGATWSRGPGLGSEFGESLVSIHFTDADHGVALGDGGHAYRTVDGGATWSAQKVTPDDSTRLSALVFGDAQTAWVLGGVYSFSPNEASCNFIRQSTDGGETWAPPASYVIEDLRDVSFVSATQGWAVGADGTVMVTTDGEHWATQAVPVTTGLRGVDFVDALTGWAVGDDGTILATVDGGTTWHQQPSGNLPDLTTVGFLDAEHGWAAGSNSVFRTTDGGLAWTEAAVGSGEWTLDAASVDFVDATHGWVAGSTPGHTEYGRASGVVYATQDGGATWTRQDVALGAVHAVEFVDDQYGWAAYEGGGFMRTTDGGSTWENCRIITDDYPIMHINDLCFIDRIHGWGVGTAGVIFATADGQNWILENSGARRDLYGVSFVDRAHGWVVGDGGLILEDPGPLVNAPYRCVVRRGRLATLRFKVSTAAVVRVNVKIRIRNARRQVMSIDLRNQRPNQWLKATFRCTLRKGTYSFLVYARDTSGNKAAMPAVNKLIVR